jgi:hypothetical protein
MCVCVMCVYVVCVNHLQVCTCVRMLNGCMNESVCIRLMRICVCVYAYLHINVWLLSMNLCLHVLLHACVYVCLLIFIFVVAFKIHCQSTCENYAFYLPQYPISSTGSWPLLRRSEKINKITPDCTSSYCSAYRQEFSTEDTRAFLRFAGSYSSFLARRPSNARRLQLFVPS